MVDAEPSQILDHVFLGNRTHARDRKILQRLRITHILNVTPPKKMDSVAGVPNFFEKDAIFTYRRCSIFDNKAEDISGVLEGCIAFIGQAKYYGRILVHCNKGVSRSSSMVIAYLMKLHSMTFEHALAFVVERRPMANPNENFRQQLQEYGRHLQRKVPKSKETRSARGPAGPQLPSSTTFEKKVLNIGPHLPPGFTKEADSDNCGDGSDGIDGGDGQPNNAVDKTVSESQLSSQIKRIRTNEGERPSKKKK